MRFALDDQIAPYRPRRTQTHGVVESAGWSIKITSITSDGGPPEDREIEAAVGVAQDILPAPALTPTRSGIGFIIVHRGDEALWVIVCWWELDILYHRMWRADLGTTDLRRVPPEGPTACVWELLVIDHERRAWVEFVLRHPAAPDFAGYLASELSIDG